MGVLLGRGLTPKEIVCQDGTFAESIYSGYNFGIHIGSPEHHLIRFESDMALNVAIGTGLIDALYYVRDAIEKKTSEENPALLAFLGDGATAHGNAHSAFLFASTRKLPALFIINNNGLAIRTPVEYQSAHARLGRIAEGYGMKFLVVDGNDAVEVWRTAKTALADIRNGGGPWIIECCTFRVSGHNAHETSEMAGYVPRELRLEWQGRNPLAHYTLQLKLMHLLDDEMERGFKEEAERIIAEAFDATKTYSAPSKLHSVFADRKTDELPKAAKSNRIITYEAAINEALRQAMELDARVRVFGEDVETGGVHGVTKGLVKKFGRERVFHTPLDENGIFAYAIGMALAGLIPSPEVQFLPFLKYAFGPLLNYATIHFAVTGQNLPLVVRAPCGGGFPSNNCHEEMIEAMLAHSGGIKIVAPSTAYAAKGLLLSAFQDGNPVIFLEQISAYGKKGEVPAEPYLLPFGEARVLREGKDISIITYGAMMVERTLKAAEILSVGDGISAEVIDLQTIVPMDREAILYSVTKTNRALIVHEAKKDFGVGAEISAFINENAYECLWVPVKRLGAKDGPVTAHPALEALRLPQVEDIVAAAKEMAR
ncbi:MAG: hypothetical protein A3D92_12670 [Bacteroidetes bacterium RIFCSPHIGHO2_02_FULL_44_7]|nr:MAG: hypothetical protein A3D92_12670 [Bacteroidetes bacterium RIFCSPHIGHO2_02_FULL_44_7]